MNRLLRNCRPRRFRRYRRIASWSHRSPITRAWLGATDCTSEGQRSAGHLTPDHSRAREFGLSAQPPELTLLQHGNVSQLSPDSRKTDPEPGGGPERSTPEAAKRSSRRQLSGRAMTHSGLRIMPTFPLPSLKVRTADFTGYGFKAGVSDRAFPVRRILRVGRFAIVLRAPDFLVGSPFCAGGRCALKHLRSSGLYRSTPGAFAPDRVLLFRSILTCGPTRRHIPISPLSGLYKMPLLFTLRLGDL